ncbi:MAG: hypothetical protein ACRDZ3_23715 [Acidimicrobiia bacterium]
MQLSGRGRQGADGSVRNPDGTTHRGPRETPAGTTQIYEGTNQIQRMVIARKTFGNVR